MCTCLFPLWRSGRWIDRCDRPLGARRHLLRPSVQRTTGLGSGIIVLSYLLPFGVFLDFARFRSLILANPVHFVLLVDLVLWSCSRASRLAHFICGYVGLLASLGIVRCLCADDDRVPAVAILPRRRTISFLFPLLCGSFMYGIPVYIAGILTVLLLPFSLLYHPPRERKHHVVFAVT